jgi:hypothetical protein
MHDCVECCDHGWCLQKIICLCRIGDSKLKNFRAIKLVEDVEDLQRGESNHLRWGNQNAKEIMS